MKFKIPSKNKGDLDFTPLLDIIFLVLIFFMVAASFDLNRSLKLKLPKSFSAESDIRKNNIVIEVNQDGLISINGEEVNIRELASKIKQIKDYTNSSVYLLGDLNANYKYVIEVIDVLKILDLSNISLVTEQKENL